MANSAVYRIQSVLTQQFLVSLSLIEERVETARGDDGNPYVCLTTLPFTNADDVSY